MYEWNNEKDKSNQKKHGISFTEAEEAIEKDTKAIVNYDEEHSSKEEDRWQILAWHQKKKLLFIVTAEQIERETRIVSARKAEKLEEKIYRECL